VRQIPVDGGSGVNIIIADTARSLGYNNFESTTKVLRMADQTKVFLVGVLKNVEVLVGDKLFTLDFMVIEPATKSSYLVILGRPWLYKVKVQELWRKKIFTFGKPKTIISWKNIVHQGETQSSNFEYTSKNSDSSVDSRLIEKEEAINYIEVYDANSEVSQDNDLNAYVLFHKKEDEQLYDQENVLSEALSPES
jgi:hypothetical protein